MTKAYLAHALTGRNGADIELEGKLAEQVLFQYGCEVLDPATVEGISDKQKEVRASVEDLKAFWKRDKEMIRSADVLIDLTGPMKSEGVAHEIGYARYCLWIPVIRVWPNLGASIARLEDDFIVQDVQEAGRLIREHFGTRGKRLKWRVNLLGRHLPKWVWRQMKRMVQ